MIKKLFSETGNASLMRAMAALVIISAVGIAAVICTAVFLKVDVAYIRELIFLSGTLLGFGFAGKVVQKFAERENNINN